MHTCSYTVVLRYSSTLLVSTPQGGGQIPEAKQTQDRVVTSLPPDHPGYRGCMLSPTLNSQHVGDVVVADVVRRRARVVGSVNADNTINHQRTVVLHVESVVGFDWLAPEG